MRLQPCPACGRTYDADRIQPPRVPLLIRCACCCQHDESIETGKTKWGVRFATHCAYPEARRQYRIITYPEGGYEALVKVDGIGWVIAEPGDVPEDIERLLCFALNIRFVED